MMTVNSCKWFEIIERKLQESIPEWSKVKPEVQRLKDEGDPRGKTFHRECNFCHLYINENLCPAWEHANDICGIRKPSISNVLVEGYSWHPCLPAKSPKTRYSEFSPHSCKGDALKYFRKVMKESKDSSKAFDKVIEFAKSGSGNAKTMICPDFTLEGDTPFPIVGDVKYMLKDMKPQNVLREFNSAIAELLFYLNIQPRPDHYQYQYAWLLVMDATDGGIVVETFRENVRQIEICDKYKIWLSVLR